jgi:transcriptional regulator with XRE-family HTH domain
MSGAVTPAPLPTFFAELGPALRLLREKERVSAAAVATRAGVGKSQLSKYETGRELPKMDTLARILEVLDVEPLWFFYMMHVLSREKPVEQLGAELIRLRGGPGKALSREETEGFKRALDNLLDLHQAVVLAHLRATRESS